MKILQYNKRATFEYEIEKTIIAGMSLLGKEVKEIKDKKVNFNNAFVTFIHERPYLTHLVNRMVPLLLTSKQIAQCLSYKGIRGYTIIPIKLILSENNFLKVEICIARGASKLDKRIKIKERDERRREKRE